MSLYLFFLVFWASASSYEKTCELCEHQIQAIQDFLLENSTLVRLEELALPICDIIASRPNEGWCPKPFFSWQCRDVCNGMVYSMGPELVPLFAYHFVDPYFVCTKLGFEDCKTPQPTLEPTPPTNKLTDTGSREDSGIGYILHIPDIHYDKNYAPNTVANCGEDVCCHLSDNNHSYPLHHNDIIYSGLYGYNVTCDASPLLVNTLFDFIKDRILKEYNIDFALFVGDLPAHDLWKQTQQKNLDIIDELLNDMIEILDGIPLYYCFGNHDTFPISQFEPPPGMEWLYDPVSDTIKQQIDNKYVMNDTIQPSELLEYGGFYSTLIKPGLRLISLNSNLAADGNYYLDWTNSSRDMASQQEWLKDVLSQSASLNEHVYIMDHHPLIGMGKNQQDNYFNIYTQYKDIISGYFAGHTHVDTWHVFGTYDTSGPFGVLYNAGSITPHSVRNPRFRVYKYNRTNHKILNYDQFVFNLTLSNELKYPIWYKAYNMLNEYNMTDLSPQSFLKLSKSFNYSDELWMKYQYNYRGGLYDGPMQKGSSICHSISATKDEYKYCCQNEYNCDNDDDIVTWSKDPYKGNILYETHNVST